MSPTAGIKSGIKGCSLCSISIVLGVYLEKNTTTAWVTLNCPAKLATIIDTRESQEWAKTPPTHLLMYSKSSLISEDTGR